MMKADFCIADLGICLTCDDHEFFMQLQQWYRAFFVASHRKFCFHLVVTSELHNSKSNGPTITECGTVAECDGGSGVYWRVDMRDQTGTIRIYRDRKAFDTALRTLYSWLLPRHTGLLMHAAAVVSAGAGYVFYGYSGAGKSTIATLSHACNKQVLTDEVAAIRIIGGENRVFATPFRGEFLHADMTGRAPLVMMVQPVQSACVAVRSMPLVDTVTPVLQTVLNFCSSVTTSRYILDTVLLLTSHVMQTQMEFRKDTAFWGLLERYGHS